eukprot:1012725-Amphidinium_carterae.1
MQSWANKHGGIDKQAQNWSWRQSKQRPFIAKAIHNVQQCKSRPIACPAGSYRPQSTFHRQLQVACG